MVEPQSSGIGGGGFLVYDDGDGSPDTYDGRETAPMAAGPDWFFAGGRPLTISQAIPGGKSVGVPGNLRLMALAHRAHGKLGWAGLFAPAIRLARDGFAIAPRLNRALDRSRATGALSAEARALFYTGDGSAIPSALCPQPALADSRALGLAVPMILRRPNARRSATSTARRASVAD